MQHDDTSQAERLDRPLLFGLVLIVIGASLLIDRLTILDLDGRFWPFILILLGGVRLFVPSRSSRRPGVWLLFIGVWGLLNEFHLFGLEYRTSWPLMIIGGGLMIVWRALEGPDTGGCGRCRQEP